jgi:hypothetical protein
MVERGLTTSNLGLGEKFSNITEMEAKILNLDSFSEVKVKTENSADWENRYKGVWNIGVNRLAGIVTNEYLLVQHKNAFLPLLSVLRNSGLVKVEGRIGQDFRRAYMMVVIKDPRTTIEIKLPNGKKDPIYLALIMKHGVDGSLALWGTVGAFRQVCSNGMMIPHNEESFSTIRKVHRGKESNLLIGTFYEDLLKVLVESSEIVSDIIQRSVGEVIKGKLIEAVLYGSGFGRNYVLKILEKCKSVDQIYKWELYNNITEFITHEVETATFQKRIKYLNLANNLLTEPLEELVEKGKELIPVPKQK